MAIAAGELYREPPAPPAIDPTVRIGPGTTIGAGAAIGPHVVIGAGVTIGDRVRIGPHATIEDGVTLGDDVRLDAQVTLYAGTVLGSRVWCKAGAVIGGPGFGYRLRRHRPPSHSPGRAAASSKTTSRSDRTPASIAARSTIPSSGPAPRSTTWCTSRTTSGSAADCLIMACVGIAGSTRLGDRVIMAGQSGVADHALIGDDVQGRRPGGGADGRRRRARRSPGIRRARIANSCGASPTLYRLSAHVDTLEAMAKEREDA